MHAFDRETDRQTVVDSKTVRMLRSRTVKTAAEPAFLPSGSLMSITISVFSKSALVAQNCILQLCRPYANLATFCVANSFYSS